MRLKPQNLLKKVYLHVFTLIFRKEEVKLGCLVSRLLDNGWVISKNEYIGHIMD